MNTNPQGVELLFFEYIRIPRALNCYFLNTYEYPGRCPGLLNTPFQGYYIPKTHLLTFAFCPLPFKICLSLSHSLTLSLSHSLTLSLSHTLRHPLNPLAA